MKIQTLSAVIGTQACDGGCPFCVAGMTGFDQLPTERIIDRTGFTKAMRWAEIGGCTTCLLTGKGEPTLAPGEVTQYLEMLSTRFQAGTGFPSLEIQTNALRIGQIAQAWWDSTSNHTRDSLTAVVIKPGTNETTLNLVERYANLWEVCAPTFDIGPGNPALQKLLMEMYKWKYLGLDYIAVSVVGINPEHNKQIYLHHRKVEYPNLETTIAFLHAMGFRVRLCVMMHDNMVDCPERLNEVLQWCRDNEVEQCTARPIRKPVGTIQIDNSDDITKYVSEHGLDFDQERAIQEWINAQCREGRAKVLMTLMHGKNEVKVYDVGGQNLCLSDCLTLEETADDIRTLIFYGDGDITYDWVHRGAKLR